MANDNYYQILAEKLISHFFLFRRIGVHRYFLLFFLRYLSIYSHYENFFTTYFCVCFVQMIHFSTYSVISILKTM